MFGSKYSIVEQTTTEVEVRRKINRSGFAILIAQHHDLEEIDTELIYPLTGIDLQSIPGTTKEVKAVALVEWFAKRGRIQELWDQCNKTRPNADWKSVLGDIIFPSPPPRKWLIPLLIVLIIGSALGASIGYFLRPEPEPITSISSVSTKLDLGAETAYDFENCLLAGQEWEIGTGTTDSLACSDSFAFSGNSSLAVPIEVRKRNDTNSPIGTTQLWLQNEALTHKFVLLRIFLPAEAPPTLAAHLLVADEEENVHFGPLSTLEPGAWNSIGWAIEAYEDIGPLTKVGIEFKIEEVNLSPEQNTFTGMVYLDAVEIYATPSTQITTVVNTAPQLVNGTDFYSFEEESIPEWDFDPALGTPLLTDTVSLAGSQALVFKPNISARESSNDYAGPARFLLDLPEPVHDRLVVFRVYIAEDSPQNLSTQLIVVSDEDDWTWHPYEYLQPGEWTTIARSMKDVPPNYTPQKVGLQFIVEFPDGPNTIYCVNDGPPPIGFENESCLENFFVYLDSVEILPQDTRFQEGRTDDTIYYDFEDGISSAWRFYNQVEGEPALSSDHVFDGQYSLAIDTNLRAREESGDPLAVASIHLQGVDVKDKGVVFHVFVPQGAPTNLAAQPSLANQPVYGKYTPLKPGVWNTVAWSTSDAPLWNEPAEIALHVILGGTTEAENDKAAYDGLVYLDGIEILPLYRNYPSARPLDTVLQHLFTYDFNDGSVPEQFSKSQDSFTEDITSTVLDSPSTQKVLQLDLNLPTLIEGDPIETYGGGFCLTIETPQTIDLVNAAVLPANEAGSDNLQAVFTAIDELGNLYFGGFVPLDVGKWTPMVWGTDFGVFGDQWYGWDGRQVEELCLWVTSRNGYQGSVYVDNFIGFQVNE